jgi:hypothetical protein
MTDDPKIQVGIIIKDPHFSLSAGETGIGRRYQPEVFGDICVRPSLFVHQPVNINGCIRLADADLVLLPVHPFGLCHEVAGRWQWKEQHHQCRQSGGPHG